MARDERDPGPKAASAGGSPDARPHEGRQAAHHSQIRLGQRVSAAVSAPFIQKSFVSFRRSAAVGQANSQLGPPLLS